MTKTNSGRRPAIHMIDREADALADLAVAAEERFPEVSALLMGEIERATLHPEGALPPGTVSMGATVTFTDEATGTTRTIRLVYPREADIDAGRVSILTPVGAGLIGLREGQSIVWPDRDGQKRRLTIARVEPAPRG